MSEATIRLLVHGGNGRMGQALQRLGDATAGCQVVAAVSRQAGARVVEGIPQFAASELAGVPEFDVAIDFSLPQGFDAILGLCLSRGKPLVSGALPVWDCDIVETHHVRKLDAPSGTALTLGAAAAQGGASPRYASIRAGDIVGEHLVQFATAGERIELVHRASNRDIFARGALHVARAIHGRAAGRHRIADLL